MNNRDTEFTEKLSKQYGVKVYISENHSIYTTSIDVSEIFGRRHDHVLRDIEKITNENMCFQPMFHQDIYIDKMNRPQKMYCITKTGLARLIFSYNRTDEKVRKAQDNYMFAMDAIEQKFRILLNKPVVVQQVGPAIGTKEYFAQALIAAQQVMDAQEQTITEQNKQIAVLEPQAKFANAISSCDGGVLIRVLATEIQQAAKAEGFRFSIGEKRLYNWMRNQGYITKSKRPTPVQRYVEQGLFWTKANAISTDKGSFQRNTILVTGKGQEYFTNKFVDMIRKGVDIAAQWK